MVGKSEQEAGLHRRGERPPLVWFPLGRPFGPSHPFEGCQEPFLRVQEFQVVPMFSLQGSEIDQPEGSTIILENVSDVDVAPDPKYTMVFSKGSDATILSIQLSGVDTLNLVSMGVLSEDFLKDLEEKLPN